MKYTITVNPNLPGRQCLDIAGVRVCTGDKPVEASKAQADRVKDLRDAYGNKLAVVRAVETEKPKTKPRPKRARKARDNG